ncbi:MAG TPA: hypothetical protein VGK24_05895 [Candidatus Angelobacter sp.]|jgi:hypothetical protein
MALKTVGWLQRGFAEARNASGRRYRCSVDIRFEHRKWSWSWQIFDSTRKHRRVNEGYSRFFTDAKKEAAKAVHEYLKSKNVVKRAAVRWNKSVALKEGALH